MKQSTRTVIDWTAVVGSYVVIAFIFLFIAVLIGAWGEDQGYSDGYCAALNGVALNQETCDVDGKVVEIR